jgi:hypothetical protein
MRTPFIVLRFALAGTVAATGLLTALPGARAATNVPEGKVCTAGWEYNPVYVGEAHVGKGALFKDHNGTSHSATVTFTSTSTSTVSYSVTASGSFDIDVILAGADASVGGGLTLSYADAEGNQISISVPAHDYGYGQYGAWRSEFQGYYEYVNGNCEASDQDYITAWIPQTGSGWDTWTSSS